MMTTEDLAWEDQKKLQRQLNLCAKNLQKLAHMTSDILGEEGGVYMDASPCLYVMHGDGDFDGPERQKHILLSSTAINGRIGAGDW